MKIKIKKVYYCDFCGKRSLRSLAEHEKHCTANPDRECRLCKKEGNPPVRPIIEKYRKYFRCEWGQCEWGRGMKVIYQKDFTLDDIRNELISLCPNCILTIIRCLGLNKIYFGGKFKYDYKEELKNWWR